MSTRKRTSTGLLLLYLLPLLQPQPAAALQTIGNCPPGSCADSSAGFRSDEPAVWVAGPHARMFGEPTRQAGDLSLRFTAGVSDTCLEATAALTASGKAATCKHREVLHLIRDAGLALPACSSRPPPIA